MHSTPETEELIAVLEAIAEVAIRLADRLAALNRITNHDREEETT